MRGGIPNRRGQAESISVVLLIAATIAGTIFIVGIASFTLDEDKQSFTIQKTEHAMTLLDSRASLVALGDSNSQTIDLGGTEDGTYTITDDAGRVTITHSNQSGASDLETLYNASLGAIIYENEDTVIAYQGGGVWRKENNGSFMVSPPEFHYRAATLTFPIIRVSGTGSATGRIVTEITKANETRRVYPNNSAAYETSGDAYANPIQEGNITVTIQSQYYEAWEEYFRTRTDGEITVDHTNETIEVKLLSLGYFGDFTMPADGNAITINGLNQNAHSISTFNITLYPDDTDSANFANLQWSLYAERGGNELEIHLRDSGDNDDPSTACTERDISLTIYYSDMNGDPYHGWYNDTAFRTECYDADDGIADETRLVANLTSDTQLTMQGLSAGNLNYFSPSGATRATTITFDEHSDSVSWEPKTFDDTGDSDAPMGRLIRHYFAMMGPNIDLTVDDKNSNTVNEDASLGTLELDRDGPKFLTFLHITENDIRIELE